MPSAEALFFTASWCEPCRQAAPIFSEVVAELGLDSRLVDVDLAPDVADSCQVTLLPTVAMVEEGTCLGIIEGSRPKAELRTLLRDLAPAEPAGS